MKKNQFEENHIKHHNTENLVLLGVLGITLLSGALLTLPSASADDVVDTITITVPTSCSISSTGENSHTAEINNGQYNSAIGETTIKAFCNDNEGFAIYAIGYTDNELGKNVLTNATLGATHDIVTGTAISGSTSNWAMKLSTITSPTPTYPIIIAGSSADTLKQQTDPDFSNFTNVPDDYKKVAYRTAPTDINPEGSSTAEGSTLKTTYQVYISPTQSAGEYVGQVKYTMLHPYTEPAPFVAREMPAASGQICYYPNTDEHEGTMGCQTISDYAKDWSQCEETDYSSYCYDDLGENIFDSLSTTNSAIVTLLASNFSRDGYGFAGWSDKFDYATNTNANFYGPQETITIPDTSIYTGDGKGLSLYAVWVKSAGSLQDQSKVAQLCGTNGTGGSLTTAPTNGTANLSSVSALTDQRDHQTYAIAKLADGKCWMIENLRLEAEDTRTAEKQALAQGYGTSATYGNFGGLANAESANFKDSTTANSLYYSGTQSGDATINIGTTDYPGYRMPRYNNTNTSVRASASDNNYGSMYSYGNYYTWHAAIADLTYNGTNNSSVTNTSLCPTGWRLPQGGNKTRIESNDDNDFWNLTVDALNGGTNPANYDSSNPYYTGTAEAGPVADKLRSYPNNFLYSGRFNSSSAGNRGSHGLYWSSTAGDSYYSYSLYLNSSYVYPGASYSDKFRGFSIRCVSDS